MRIDTQPFDFPRICPVCLKAAEYQGEIHAVSQRDSQGHPARSFVGSYRSTRFRHLDYDNRLLPPSVSRLRVPTCRAHAHTPDKSSRRRTFFGFIAGVSTMSTLLLGTFMSFSFYDGNPIALEWYIMFFLAVSLMIASLVDLGPNALERAISVQHMLPNAGKIILRVKNKEYLDEILRLNPTKSTPVKRKRHPSP